MNVDILTLFPEMFTGPFDCSIIKRARHENLVSINLHNLRNWGRGKHKQVDDRLYGGGVGMILRVDVVVRAIEEIKSTWLVANSKLKKPTRHKASPDAVGASRTILLTPQGKLFSQKKAWELSKLDHLILVCGHYEGFDERVRNFVDEEISVGDYILTGGEIPAMVIVDCVVRLIPGVLEKPEALANESFAPYTPGLNQGGLAPKPYPLIEYPQYTRPPVFRGLKVPKVLLSGDHEKIKKWRKAQALKKTREKRPDLLSINK